MLVQITALKFARGPVYNTGMVVWYADESFTDNWVGDTSR